MSNDEVWKPIVGFEGLYEVSNYGRVKSFHRGKMIIRKYSNQRNGYYQLTLCKDGQVYYRWPHRLVAQAFLEPIPNKEIVNHKDGNKKNNHFSNLEYCTMAENNAHAGRMNLKPIGTNHTNSKLTHEDLKEIRQLLDEKNLSHKQISKMFGVHRTCISKIFRNVSYAKEST